MTFIWDLDKSSLVSLVAERDPTDMSTEVPAPTQALTPTFAPDNGHLAITSVRSIITVPHLLRRELNPCIICLTMSAAIYEGGSSSIVARNIFTPLKLPRPQGLSRKQSWHKFLGPWCHQSSVAWTHLKKDVYVVHHIVMSP